MNYADYVAEQLLKDSILGAVCNHSMTAGEVAEEFNLAEDYASRLLGRMPEVEAILDGGIYAGPDSVRYTYEV